MTKPTKKKPQVGASVIAPNQEQKPEYVKPNPNEPSQDCFPSLKPKVSKPPKSRKIKID